MFLKQDKVVGSLVLNKFLKNISIHKLLLYEQVKNI